MSGRDTFLREHAVVHRRSVGGSPFAMDWMLDGLDAHALRARPHGTNPIAWLLWHLARVEDRGLAGVVMGAPQLLDDGWAARLGVDHRTSDGEGMSKDEVLEIADALDMAALLAYRDAVGARTRTLVKELDDVLWHAPLEADDLAPAVASGALVAEDAPRLVGTPRDQLLLWWGVGHNHHHLGQIALVRRLGQDARTSS